MYAIFDITHKQITNQFSNKTAAWGSYLAKHPDVARFYDSREDTLARLRRHGFYCDYAYGDLPKAKPKSKAKPKAKAAAAPAVLKVETKVEKSIVLDISFAKAMHKFFKDKQSKGEIEYIYEYKSYGSEGDAEKLLEHMTKFLTGYTPK
jgi:hypothetical protein